MSEQPSTCPNVGQGRNLMGNVMSNDWMDLFYFILQTLLNTVEGVFGYLLVIYGIVLIFLLCLTLRTAVLQFEYILRPCLPSAKKRGYWKSDGPTDKNRYRLRWPLLSLYAVCMFCVDAVCGALMSLVWPIWFPLFFFMIVTDTIQIMFNWFLGKELYGKNLPKPVHKKKHRNSRHLPDDAVQILSSPKEEEEEKKKKITSGFRSILGYLLWPIQIVFYFIVEVCYEGIFKPFYQYILWLIIEPGSQFWVNWNQRNSSSTTTTNNGLVVNENS